MRPRRPLLIVLTGWTAVGLAAAWWPPAQTAWNLLGFALAGLASADLLLLARAQTPTARRELAHILPQGQWSPVTLTLTNPQQRRLRLDWHDGHPAAWAVQAQPQTVTLPARSALRAAYRLCPPRRGAVGFGPCQLRLHSPLRLWSQRRYLDLPAWVRVYPHMAGVSGFRLLATTDPLARLGIRRQPRRGSGAEFHQLREYRHGDSLRQIDWKATARMRRPIAREYQDERDQRLVFLLDCGRRMRHQDAQGRGHLDQALDAALLLAAIALRQGDAVGLLTYGGPQRWFAPRQGPDTLRRLLAAVYDLEASLQAADPLLAARALLLSQPRRALVVLITNSRDEDHPELLGAVRLLRRQHLLVIADLREASLDAALAAPITRIAEAQRWHAVQAYLHGRRRQHERLAHLGARVLDTLPRQLPLALLNQYLEIKQAGVL